MSARKTLKRATAETLFEFAKSLVPDDARSDDVAALFAQAEYELHGGIKPRVEKDFEFEQLWKLMPDERRVGKQEALRLYRQLRMLDDWPGAEAVQVALFRAIERVAMKSQFYGDRSWVQFVPLLETWLRKRRHLDG